MIETKFGNFEIIQNERDAFDLVKFENKYLPEYFDKYSYLVGDLSDDILRLKGFSLDPKSKSYFHFIPEYLTESCSYNCKYYILKRIKNKKTEDEALFAKYIGSSDEPKVEVKAEIKEEKKESPKEEKKIVEKNETVENQPEEKKENNHKKKFHKFKKFRQHKKKEGNQQ